MNSEHVNNRTIEVNILIRMLECSMFEIQAVYSLRGQRRSNGTLFTYCFKLGNE